ncbi:MAG: hypothetical protein ACPG4A_06660 [Pseudomonadales bacterium]
MPLNFVSSGGGSPFIRFSVEDNEWVRSTSEGDLTTVDMGSAPVLIDIENIQQGWLKLSGGRDWVEWPNNDPTSTPKPSDMHKQGISLKFYSSKLFGDEPTREFCTSGVGALEFVKKLYAECEDKFGKGEVPVVHLTGSTKVKIGKGNSRIPNFEVKGWKARPEDLGSSETTSSSAAAPAESSPTAAATDDVNFDEI